jgi:hypothetical protein
MGSDTLTGARRLEAEVRVGVILRLWAWSCGLRYM